MDTVEDPNVDYRIMSRLHSETHTLLKFVNGMKHANNVKNNELVHDMCTFDKSQFDKSKL